ncbi:MAG: TonB-dependent receptor [Lentimicrobiaceae bacterium]|jgi:iron complex outermembrane receptor protein
MKKNLISFRILLLFVAWAFAFQAFAQDIQVTGKVSDAKDGSSLPGATVQVKGTTIGALTDLDGKYSLKVKAGSVLSFSFIGYDPQEVTITKQREVNIALQQSSTTLQQVVVIGYGQVKKSDATGSISVTSSKDFNKGAITSPQDLLVGKSAGVVITTSGGAPGSGATIRVRGGSSLNASNDPLIIVDGVPLDNNDINGSSNFLSFINPNDIETFTVLKDASATAIYGSRASNGVILITTKKGQVGSAMKLTYDGNTSISSAIKFMDVYSGDQIREIAFNNKDLFGVESFEKLGSQNTNWQKEIFRTAISQDHNLSLSGAYKSLPYRVSLGYTDQNGILKNTDLQRTTGSISLDPTLFNKSLKVNINLKGMSTDNNFGDAGALGSAINMDPTQVVMDGNPLSGGYYQWSNYGANLGTPNPVEQLMDVDNKSKVQRVIGNIQLNYKMPFIPDLNANLNMATDYTKSDGHNNLPIDAPSVLTSPYLGKINSYSGKNYNNLLDFYLNYAKELSAISSKIDATAGYSWQHFKREGDSYTTGYHLPGETAQIDSSSFITENYLVSFFGRLNYTFMDRYLLTFTIRDDGSSRFAKNQRWGLFPSVAFAWKIKEESFLKDVKAISDLKLRIGWGVTGQQDLKTNDYPAQATYITSSPGSYYMIDGKYIPTLRPSAYDPDIKWEETTTQNIGLDFGFADNRISGSFDLYKRVTKDLLNTVNVPSGSNFSNTLLTNVGSLENKGAEVSLNLVPISSQDMYLSIGFNVSYNLNKITKLNITDDPNYKIQYGSAFTGFNQVTIVGYPAYSYFLNQQVYDVNGKPIEGMYVDLSGQGGTVNGNAADKYITHNPVPDYLLGFSARFTYKNFDFSGSTRASIGNYVFNMVAAGSSYDQMYQIGYWKNFPTYLSDTKFVKRQFTSDYFLENASFFKLDNLSAGYKFDKIYKKMSARISFTVQNVLTVTKYKGLDPEVPGGIDNNFYPRPRTFMLGVSLSY